VQHYPVSLLGFVSQATGDSGRAGSQELSANDAPAINSGNVK